MPERDILNPLLAALDALCRWLEAEEIPGIVIGGVAASLLGRPRLTRDVDAVILLPEERWEVALEAAARYGLEPRLPDAGAFARSARVFLLRHQPTGVDVDVAIGSLPFEEEAIGRAQLAEAAGLRVPVPTPEDLIVMKAVAHRPRDAADIESIVDAHPHLDRRRVRRWLRAFADALDQPELLTDAEKALSRRRKRSGDRGRHS